MSLLVRSSSLAAVLFVSLTGACADQPEVADTALGGDSTAVTGDPATTTATPDGLAASPDPAPVAGTTGIVTDLCDESTFTGVTWASASAGHFTLNFLPNTAPDREQAAIFGRLESAHANIRATLGVAIEPNIVITLSPSRTAAVAHGKLMGVATPHLHKYEALYTGAADSFEIARPGNLMSYIFEFYLDEPNYYRHPFLKKGLAEILDQSGRNYHHAYAEQLLAGVESTVSLASFDARDVASKNYGRAGSLVKFLIDRYGMQGFLSVYKATKVTWTNGCWTHAVAGCISSSSALTAMIDSALQTTVGETWAQVQPAWEVTVNQALNEAPAAMTSAATAEIGNLVALMDEAINKDDGPLYRSTMEGFYCDWGGEGMRETIAGRTVGAINVASSEVLSIVPTGVKNFSSARATVRRTADGVASTFTLQVENVAGGWRVTYGPDWQ